MPRWRRVSQNDGTWKYQYVYKEYEATRWSPNGDYNYSTRQYDPPKIPRPPERQYHVSQRIGPAVTETTEKITWRVLDTQEILDTLFTKDNADIITRYEQAHLMAHAGYAGPVSGGEARGLKNLFNALGLPDNVRHGHIIKAWKEPNARYYQSFIQRERLQSCYVFKSPVPEIPFDKFIKLARLYKDDKGGIRRAVQAVMANPDAKNEVQASDAIEMLSKLTGM